MDSIQIILLVVFLLFAILLVWFSVYQKRRIDHFISDNSTFRDKLYQTLKEYHKENKDDYERAQTSQREELSTNIKAFNDSFNTSVTLLSDNQKNQLENLQKSQQQRLESMEKSQDLRMESLEKNQREKLESIEKSQAEKLLMLDKSQTEMVKSTNDKLEDIRKTVEEKLDKTLTDRIGKSFETVSKQLEGVQKGLGEMKSLADDVGGLKKVLSNVKMRGGIGETQLKRLLEQFLAPAQYAENVKTKRGSDCSVEFAIKFPGTDGNYVWLPIDSKFPQDTYEHLLNAYESADKEAIERGRTELAKAIKKNAKDIADKYIDIPNTTKFAIMFLPFESLYAEVVRDGALLESIQSAYNISVAGPTNLAAILTSFQLGFQTLAIQKRGDQVWNTLGKVKSEFEKFGGMLEKAKGKIEGGLKDLDSLATTRTNKINSALRNVSTLDDAPELLSSLDESSQESF